MIKYLAAAIFAITMIGLIYVAVAEQDPPNSGDAASDVSLVNSGVEASSGNVGVFDRPVQLYVNGEPLNAEVKRAFPSPAIFDVNRDGNTELVIGDLMGGIGVYTNLNTSGAGDPIWSSRKELEDFEGNPINTPNW